jgi:hypothetical protein
MRGWNPCFKAVLSAVRRTQKTRHPGNPTFVLVVEVRDLNPWLPPYE